jgi:hypothetical protein
METRDNSSTSIKNQRPLRLESTTNHGISRALAEQPQCKSGAQTLDGGNCSAMKEDSSLTCGITEFLMSTKEKTLNIRRLSSIRDTVEKTRNGRSDILIQYQPRK